MTLNNILDHCNYLLHNYNNNILPYVKERCSEDYFTFGYYPENINLLKDYFDEKYLKDLKLLRQQETNNSIQLVSYFHNYELVIGFKDLYGNLLGLVARTLKDYKLLNIPKYKNTQYKKTNHLFGLYESLNQIKEQDYVIITEGQFDVIKAFDKNIKNIVSVGCSNISENQFLLLKRFTNNILVCLDNDDAGINGFNLFYKKYNNYANIKKVNLPEEYKDIDEFLTDNSKQDFELFYSL